MIRGYENIKAYALDKFEIKYDENLFEQEFLLLLDTKLVSAVDELKEKIARNGYVEKPSQVMVKCSFQDFVNLEHSGRVLVDNAFKYIIENIIRKNKYNYSLNYANSSTYEAMYATGFTIIIELVDKPVKP